MPCNPFIDRHSCNLNAGGGAVNGVLRARCSCPAASVANLSSVTITATMSAKPGSAAAAGMAVSSSITVALVCCSSSSPSSTAHAIASTNQQSCRICGAISSTVEGAFFQVGQSTTNSISGDMRLGPRFWAEIALQAAVVAQ